VLFLDEPTTGLDPRSRLGMWDLIEALVAEGTTTLLTTQYLEEADRLAHHIVVVDHGLAIARGTPEELKATMGGDRVLITLCADQDADAALGALDSFVIHGAVPSTEGHLLSVGVRAGTTTPAVIHALDAARITVVDVAIERPTLDDVFLSLTGHTADDDLSIEGAR
jgi:ABC-2 type transport system ATP-binding protein